MPSPNPRRSYRGGFSSSICDLFGSYRNRSDCCALACCGLLLADKNTYLLTNERPPAWWRRLLINLGLPLVVVVVFAKLALSTTDPDEQTSWILLGILVWAVLVTLLCFRGWYYRYQQRKRIMREMLRHRGSGDIDFQVSLYHCDMLLDTACCACVDRDTREIYENAQDPVPDICTSLWQFLASICCCCCWCQCCGVCAVAQEHRELQGMFEPPDMDYVTYQTFDDYKERLENVRIQEERSFWIHLKSMSKLSRRLTLMFAMALVGVAILATPIDQDFDVANLLVVVATLFQPFLVLHFVHWRWNRFDLSLDAVVKFFASGFILSVGMALLYEMVVGLVMGIFTKILLLITSDPSDLTPPPDAALDPDAMKEWQKHFVQDNFVVLVFTYFLQAFVIAAFIEELVKYFGFWMVEHPDLSRDSSKSNRSKGAAITIAMVTTALGFACCENLMYVFGNSSSGTQQQAQQQTPMATWKTEVIILAVRVLLPAHPVAAALQSIGVCRRDLEGDRSTQLGRILLPAILLHGSFDFVLFLGALIQVAFGKDDSDKPVGQQLEDQLPYMIVVAVLLIIGLVTYFVQADAQRMRLHELDQAPWEGGVSLLALSKSGSHVDDDEEEDTASSGSPPSIV